MHANEKTDLAPGDVAARHGESPVTTCTVPVTAATSTWRSDDADEEPDDREPELMDPGNREIDDLPDGDDAYWDVFIPDEDERDPLPEPGDFWIEESQESRSESQEPEG
jgi:hypothetical protein